MNLFNILILKVKHNCGWINNCHKHLNQSRNFYNSEPSFQRILICPTVTPLTVCVRDFETKITLGLWRFLQTVYDSTDIFYIFSSFLIHRHRDNLSLLLIRYVTIYFEKPAFTAGREVKNSCRQASDYDKRENLM